jgi:hypothetical protein
MRSSAALDASTLGPWGPSTTLAIGYGPAFLIHAIYAYALFLFGGVVLLEFGVRSSPQHREQVVLLVVAMLIPLSLSIAYVNGFRPLGNFDLTPFGFTVASAVGA